MKIVKSRVSAVVVGVLLTLASVAIAQRPKENVSPALHPNIAAAQELCDQAWKKVLAAQEANEFDLGGHAQKAKELLVQVNRELKAAAIAANHR
jgi:hypothetical protein